MPFGIIGSLVVCTIIYILVSIVLTMIVPYTELNVPDPVAVAVDAFGPQWALVRQDHQGRRDHRPDLGHPGADVRPDPHLLHHGPRRPAAEGLLDACIRSSARPGSTRWWSACWSPSAAGFFDINFLGDATSVGTLAAFGIVCLTVIWLRRTHPDMPRGYRVPLYPVLPALGIVSCFALIFTVQDRVLIFFALVHRSARSCSTSSTACAIRNWPRAIWSLPTRKRPYFPEDAPRDEDGKPVIRP